MRSRAAARLPEKKHPILNRLTTERNPQRLQLVSLTLKRRLCTWPTKTSVLPAPGPLNIRLGSLLL